MNTRKALAAIPCIFILLLCGVTERAEALLANHDCSFCHDFHGNPGYSQLLVAENSEMVCLSCHTVSMGETAAAEVHNPLGLASNQPGYITCRECHDAHDSQGGNVKMVGYRRDAENWSASFTAPGIRKELPSTVGLTYNVVTFVKASDTSAPFDFSLAGSAVGACEVCHTPPHGEGEDCTACHGHNGGFLSSGGGDCRICHDGTGTGAELVSVDSPHSTNSILATTGVTFTCENCHTDHIGGTVLIPNNNAVGISYGTGGIPLGNSGGGLYNAAGQTEAEICWNCHASYGVSEWGLNSDTNGAWSNYNTGTLSGAMAPQWVSDDGTTGATWSSALSLFSYKSGAIQSTHSVNNGVLSPGLDAVEAIRCSYCHDVHELNLAVGDISSGSPYLRGNWMGNPYPEDGAPQSGTVYGQYEWGPVPRGSVLNNEYGGYQIDQNNGGPTTSWTLSASAGLCTLCHGTDVDNMNQFGAASDDWVGINGHSNAVIGGTSANAANIFYTSDRAPSGVDTQGANPDMGYANHGTGVGYGFRGTDGRSFLHSPGMDGSQASKSTQPYGGSYYEWGASVDETATDLQYHQFSCSKCHNPHASRLPRLMITNCLDTRHNTWDENAGDGGPSKANLNNNKITLSLATSPDNWLRTWSNTTSAQNCHRLAGNNSAGWSPGNGKGWNYVTPW